MVALFPGQGTQVAGAAGDLCARFAEARRTYDEASEAIGFDLVAACDGGGSRADDTEVVQPGVVTHAVACWRIMRDEFGLEPGLLAGHSVGEIAALTCADAISLGAAMDLIRHRAEAMAACPPGAMMVIFGLPEQEAAEHCAVVSTPEHPVCIGLRNAPDQVVISGDRAALDQAAARCERAGGVVQRLKVSVAAHSPLMAAAVTAVAARLSQIEVADPSRPVISGATGVPYQTVREAEASLLAQMVGPVEWRAVTRAIAAAAPRVSVELGARGVLTKLLRRELPAVHGLTAGRPEDLAQLGSAIAVWGDPSSGRPVSRDRTASHLGALLRVLAGTPARVDLAPDAFQDQVRRPYLTLAQQRADVGAGPEWVPAATLADATSMAASVLAAKGFSATEIGAWLASCAPSEDDAPVVGAGPRP